MADSERKSIGRKTSGGPGWWLASDGKWYPPELEPGKRARAAKKRSSTSKGRPKTPSDSTAPAAPPDTETPDTGTPDTETPDTETSDTDRRTGQQKYTAHPPATDQIAARRIQAKEQNVLLAGARQKAALRAIADRVGEEPALAGVGGRSFDARAGSVGVEEAPASTSPRRTQPETAEPGDGRDQESDNETTPPSRSRAKTPATVPDPPDPGPVGHAEDDQPAGTVAPDPPASSQPTDAAESEPDPEPTPAPHQPTKGPRPAAAAMGTDAPFMEVRGSALGTDIDRIGEKILIFSDRVELQDRSSIVKQTIRYDQLATVVIQKKIMGPTLLIESISGETMTAKALRPETATGAKAMVDKHARRFRGEDPAEVPPTTGDDAAEPLPAPPVAPAVVEPAPEPGASVTSDRARPTHKHVLSAMVDELHAAGILSDEERDQKLALIEVRNH